VSGLDIGYLAVPREVPVCNQFKYIECQIDTRDSFEPQRLFGALSNQNSLNLEFFAPMTNLVSGEQLKAARILAGLSQEQLAKETGRSLRTITGWESTTGTMPCASRNSLEKVEAALGRYGVALYVTPAGGYGAEKAPGRLLKRTESSRR
jgi:DNA-binding XRE family transcriptional regulator